MPRNLKLELNNIGPGRMLAAIKAITSGGGYSPQWIKMIEDGHPYDFEKRG